MERGRQYPQELNRRSVKLCREGEQLIARIAGQFEIDRERVHPVTDVAGAAGRKPKLPPRTVASVRALLAERDEYGRPIRTRSEVAADLGVSRATLGRTLERHGGR